MLGYHEIQLTNLLFQTSNNFHNCSIATEVLRLATTDEVGIILDAATVSIVGSIFERVLLVVEVTNELSIEISLTLDHVKYGCSAAVH